MRKLSLFDIFLNFCKSSLLFKQIQHAGWINYSLWREKEQDKEVPRCHHIFSFISNYDPTQDAYIQADKQQANNTQEIHSHIMYKWKKSQLVKLNEA